jgi:hypothetical protein
VSTRIRKPKDSAYRSHSSVPKGGTLEGFCKWDFRPRSLRIAKYNRPKSSAGPAISEGIGWRAAPREGVYSCGRWIRPVVPYLLSRPKSGRQGSKPSMLT